MDDDVVAKVRAQAQAGVAGALLVIATTHANPVVRQFAESAAKVVAQHGLEQGRGWLRGIWYTGGNLPVRTGPGPEDGGRWHTTYHGVVLVLQVPLGLDIVRAADES